MRVGMRCRVHRQVPSTPVQMHEQMRRGGAATDHATGLCPWGGPWGGLATERRQRGCRDGRQNEASRPAATRGLPPHLTHLTLGAGQQARAPWRCCRPCARGQGSSTQWQADRSNPRPPTLQQLMRPD